MQYKGGSEQAVFWCWVRAQPTKLWGIDSQLLTLNQNKVCKGTASVLATKDVSKVRTQVNTMRTMGKGQKQTQTKNTK